MDRSGEIRNLFSRGSSPPGPQHPYGDQTFQPQHAKQHQHISPTGSLRGHVQSSSPSHVESLFSNLNASAGHRGGGGPFSGSQHNSAPATPVSSIAQSASPSVSAPISIPESRQSALLSLLSSVPSDVPSGSAPLPALQQIPTPPGSSQRSGYSNDNESQGRLLLEKLILGAPQPNYGDTQASLLPHLGPSPPYVSPPDDVSQHETGSYYEPEISTPHGEPRENFNGSPAGQTEPQPPSPSQKPFFEFVSPFDALASTLNTARKPAPPATLSQGGLSGQEEHWSPPSLTSDPKRKSVDNLIDQLTRTQPPSGHSVPYDVLPSSGEMTPVEQPSQTRTQPRPLPPKPTQSSSPRNSPPKVPAQPRRDAHSSEIVAGPLAGSPVGQVTRDKDHSPSPRGSWKGHEGRARNSGQKGRSQSGPQSQPQMVVFDVSQTLGEIQAPAEAVKSTAIALVKVDSTFLPGTTIGATHWVAYAMTKGRVRVISRSSGDRTLLQLPQLFPPATALTDMAVYGNRLAGVTSDGGFVVWELPEHITDDVPGKLLLCIRPAGGADALHSVKWHSRQQDVLAVASQANIYLLNVLDAAAMYRGDPIVQSDLLSLVQPFSMSSPLVAMEFDLAHSAIATISEDSILTFWNTQDNQPFWSQRIRGDDMPSSITFVDNGLIIGRKHGTIFQLLPHLSRNVLATVKFVNGESEDSDMFGHANYDARIQTLWVANSRRDSMIAFKLGFETTNNGDEPRGYIQQVLEFVGPRPTIHFAILTAVADPNGEEAHAACIAAKVPVGDLALVAFSVHSTGVDQVLIRREWFDGALATALSKLPTGSAPYTYQNTTEPKATQLAAQHTPPIAMAPPVQSTLPLGPSRTRSPPSDEVETEQVREEGRPVEGRGRGKGRNVGWKDKDENGSKEKSGKGSESSNESSIGNAMAKEIKKMEETLYSRIGRLVGKELDKQHQRLEEVRANEQAADFARQEKILKLISNELTKNTTRVVEMAVRAEVQNSVLPSLENITKNEVKAALNGQIAKGLGESMNNALPNEIEKLLLRPDVFNLIARTLSSSIAPVIEKHVKEAISKTLIPAYKQESSAMHQELSREMHGEMLNLKKEVIAWQSDTLRGQEAVIRELEQSVRSLSDQVKYLSVNSVIASQGSRHSPASQQGPGAVVSYGQHRQHPVQIPIQYGPPPPQQMHGPWFPSGIPAPQASHPALPPPAAAPTVHRTPPTQHEEWDDTYLAVLGTQDPRQLRELLARSNPEAIMPLNGPGPLSQAVVLTLVHRLSAAIGESAPVDEAFKSSLWWLQRAAAVLNTGDPLISPYAARVLPTVRQMLNTIKQRILIIPPGGPQTHETVRSITEIQDVLSNKPL